MNASTPKLYLQLSLLAAAVTLGGTLRAEYNEIGTDFPMTGPTDFIAEAGVTNVYTGLISGTGPAVVKGGGTVAFSHANNTYTGGTIVSNAVFRLDADGCAGSGTITAAVNSAHIFLNCANVPNDMALTEYSANGFSLKPGEYPANNTYPILPLRSEVSVEGSVSFSSGYRIFFADSTTSGGAIVSPLPTVTYKKGMACANGALHLVPYGRMIFEGRYAPSSSSTAMLGFKSEAKGTLEFHASSNVAKLVELYHANLDFKAVDAFPDTFFHYKNGSAGWCTTYLNGNDQTILGVGWTNPNPGHDSTPPCMTSADEPATLRIVGCAMNRTAGSLVNKLALVGKVTLVMDVAPAYTQAGFYQDFSVRLSDTTGDLIISNGDFRVSGTASFPNVPNIYVGTGGSFSNSSTTAGAFAGCRNLTVLGTMACTGDAEPFGYATMALSLGADASFSLPVGATATVKSLTVGGTALPEDTYGDGGTPLAQIKQGMVVVRSGNLYVDCVSGNDANDGTAGRPFKTIKAATDVSISGDVIHVAPGTYGEAEGSQKSNANTTAGFRVVVPEGVTLVGTEGAEATFIVGAEATGDKIDNDTYKTGANGVRCVCASNGAVVCGFTLTGGRGVGLNSGDNSSAAFHSITARGATIDNCIVSNNVAYQYTINQAVVKRSRVFENAVTMSAGKSGAAGCSCSWYGSIIDKNKGAGTIYDPIAIESCTIGGDNLFYDGTLNPQVVDKRRGVLSINNSVIVAGRGRLQYAGATIYSTNSLIALTDSSWTDGIPEERRYNTKFGSAVQATVEGGTYRPVLGSFEGIDRIGATYSDALGDKDIYGTPRVLNGAIDIGAVEYDWRPKFAEELGKRFTVTYASPSVTTNATGGLLVPDGAVAGTVTSADPYLITFQSSGGSLAVYVGGVLAGESSGSGEQSIRFTVADAADEVCFVYTPDAENPGSAVLKKLSGARGFSISFR